MAAHEGPDGPHAGLPETNYVQPLTMALSKREKAIAAGAAGLLIAGGIFLYRKIAAQRPRVPEEEPAASTV